MSLKKIILSSTLLLPVLIYAFLEFFGTNTYEVPAYYSDSTPETDCYPKPVFPHKLDVDQITVFIALTTRNEFLDASVMEVQRAKNKYEVQVVAIADLNEEPVPVPEGFDLQGMLPNRMVTYVSCELLTTTQGDDIYSYIVLVDRSGTIRGYYRGGDAKEYERLLAEINILQNE